ncbi:MAG: type VI secretion system baseplate subunit TssK [Acidobacteriota bacterium]|nr:type VI secretion system baseplate subunit TssK [Acidobacteriota bacterium]
MAAKNIAWTEGQFIHPHHFQQGFLEMQEQVESLIGDFLPHAYGIAHLDFSESDCENETFLINQIDCRFPSGARLTYPGNAQIASREFGEQLNQQKGYLIVYLGLPKLHTEEANCKRYNKEARGGHRYRYISRAESVYDMAEGGTPREIEIQQYNAKILFESESTFGYEVIPIAAVSRSGQFGAVPKPDRDFIPPCIKVDASPMLLRIMRELGNRLDSKNRALREYWKTKTAARSAKAIDGFKIQSVAVAANSFSQLASTRRLHPFVLYTRIAEIIGMLSLETDRDDLVEVPQYDHDALGKCFKKAHANLDAILALLEDKDHESRVFELSGDMLVCDMEKDWFQERYDAYICFETEMHEEDVKTRVLGLKVASENVIPILNKRRIRGMDLGDPARYIPNLPPKPNHHYFKLPRDRTYYPKLVEHPILAIWGEHGFADLVTLYLVERDT